MQPWGLERSLGFTLCEIKIRWRVLIMRGVRSNLNFKGTILIVVLKMDGVEGGQYDGGSA